jgi:uncharacterized protein YndB with AHSA1/START domain
MSSCACEGNALLVDDDPRHDDAVTRGSLSRGPSHQADGVVGPPRASHATTALWRGGRGSTLARMKPIEFELERTIRAPIDQVFARLVDIEGYDEWMAGTGSMLERTRRTSGGESAVGTTFVDETSQGPIPGEIAEMDAPRTIVFHWWQKSRSGRPKFEGWPSYHLQPSGDGETLVRHRATLMSYGVWRLGRPVVRRLAVKERTVTLDALKASFERDRPPAPR